MKHTNEKHERESNNKNAFRTYQPTRQSNLMKRLLLMIIPIFMLFVGTQTTPTTQASTAAACDIVCVEYIDPSDGQCYIACCPRDEACKLPCERKPCKSSTLE
jgi:hypothetical protein